MFRKAVGKVAIFAYRLSVRLWSKAFSVLIGGSFHGFGKNSVIVPPFRISGEELIRIGNGVFIGPNSWLQSLKHERGAPPTISIGDGASMVGSCTISAVRSVVLDTNVLLARNVYISDHMHKYSDLGTPILAQGLDKVEPVFIGSGAWIGQNVIICPGVTIGAGSVIGANSVVNESIPDYCLAAGTPARVIKSLKTEAD